MLDHAAAAALIGPSRLFDEEWYAATAGESFRSRTEAIEHWLAHPETEAAPHPLFEPRWLYPGGRWQGKAPDPLSFYLSRPGARGRSPHPCYDADEHGDLESWLAEHAPSEVLVEPVPRAPAGEVTVVVPVDDLQVAVGWARQLHRRSPDVTGLLTGAGVAAGRILRAVAADLPSIRIGDDEVTSPVRVDVEPGIRPPRWPWLPDLLAALDRPGVAAAGPLLLAEDFTVAGPVLAGHPVADAERLDGLPVPAYGVVARRVGAEGETVLAAGSRVPVTEISPVDRGNLRLWEAAGFESPGVPIRVREGRPALRWSIDIAAGAGPIGTRWGDYHFARSLAAALDRLGQWVAIDHPETRGRASRVLDDVVLVIRGLHPVDPPAHTTNLLWVISHPDEVTREEVGTYDGAFAASHAWATHRSADWELPIAPLLQCTDTTRFHPGLAEPDTGPRRLFVGNARHQLRPSVAAAIETGTPLTVIGTGWEEWLPFGEVQVAAEAIPNEELPALYASAGLVLNDHWEDMRTGGFVSNRIFDVLATGARLLTDDVAGLTDVLGTAVPTWSHLSEFAHLTAEPLPDHYPDADARSALADRVVAEHSFDARAATLLDTALTLRARRDA